MQTQEKKMFFFLIDISGYTSFMLKTALDYTHGKVIILKIMETLLKEIQVPMEISKLEGDAIFLYLPEELANQLDNGNPSVLGKKMTRFFTTFSEALAELKCNPICACGACVHLEKLDLKIIGHFGKATLEIIGSFKELTGVDVIIVHRLLKNSVKERRYFLLTEACFEKMPMPLEGTLIHGEEPYPDIGTIQTYVYYPPGYTATKHYNSLFGKASKFFILNINSWMIRLGFKKHLRFHNLPEEKE